MKLGIVSDLHLGDPTSTLVARVADPPGGEGPTFATSLAFERLCETLKAHVVDESGKPCPLDYLVLLGDVFEFSIAGWKTAYAAARPFLTEIRERGLAREILYLPGNHDFSAWALTMQQANVIDRIVRGKSVHERWSVPAVLDARRSPGLSLFGVSPRESGGYGGLFFDHLGGLTFNVAYPNLYILEPSGRTTLVTHGHYFEGYWSFASRLAPVIFGDDLRFGTKEKVPTIDELVAIDFPTNELGSSGMGQAGPLTAVFRTIAMEVREGKLGRVRTYLENAADELDAWAKTSSGKGWFERQMLHFATKHLIAWVLEQLEQQRDGLVSFARFNETFFEDQDILTNIANYLEACNLEHSKIPDADGQPIQRPSRVIFGHTHVPITPDRPARPSLPAPYCGESIEFWNTGGWLRPDAAHAKEAAVVLYDSAKAETQAWQMHRITVPHETETNSPPSDPSRSPG